MRIASLAASAATGYVYACALAALFAAAVPFGGLIGRLTLTHGKTSGQSCHALFSLNI